MTTKEKQVLDLICPAIAQKKFIKFWYQDTTNKKDTGTWRTVEPHLIGLKTKKDIATQSVQLSAWVRLNATDNAQDLIDGKSDGWRTYKLEGMASIQILDNSFSTARAGYNRNDSTMEEIYCRI